jgi:hypothetical protein
MHRLVYLCDWLPPEFGAVGQYALLAARERAARGEDVTLAGLSSTASSVEEEPHGAGRLQIVRLRASVYDRANFRARALWTLRTNLQILRAVQREIRQADEIVFTGSPPFMIHLLVPLNFFLGKRLTYRITDFHPECLMAELGRSPRPLRLFHRFTVFLRRRVHRFEVLGEDQRTRLLEIGIKPERIDLVRDASPVPILPGTLPLDPPEELAGRFLLLYSGNLGVAHDHETFVEGYRRHHREGSGRVGLWLNATGAKADRVEEILRREGLPVHRGRPLPRCAMSSWATSSPPRSTAASPRGGRSSSSAAPAPTSTSSVPETSRRTATGAWTWETPRASRGRSKRSRTRRVKNPGISCRIAV